MRKRKLRPRPSALPPLFVLAAHKALSDPGGRIPIQSEAEALERIAVDVAPIVTGTGLLDDDSNLIDLAFQEAERATDSDTDITNPNADAIATANMHGVEAGLRHGLVAGYLIAQMMARRDGAA